MGLDALNFIKSLDIMHSDVTCPVSTRHMLTVWRYSYTPHLLFYVFIIWGKSGLLVNKCTILIHSGQLDFKMVILANIVISVFRININHFAHIFAISILDNARVDLLRNLRASLRVDVMPKSKGSVR